MLFVRGNQTHAVELAFEAPVFTLKNVLQELEGVPVEDQVLTFQGVVLEDVHPLSYYGINSESSIDLSCRLIGGKVHGSLARAGKVRGQTAKVEKKEKRKKKTGRAKRRMQYNRRFVNVVVSGPGRRRGPNANM